MSAAELPMSRRMRYWLLGGEFDDAAWIRDHEQAARAEREAERLASLELRNQRREQIVRDATATIEGFKAVLQSDDGRQQSDSVRIQRLAQFFKAALDILAFGERGVEVGDVLADERGGEHARGDLIEQGLEHSSRTVGRVSVHDSSPSQVVGTASVGVARPVPGSAGSGTGQSDGGDQ